MKKGILVQARMGSTRLRGKSLLPLQKNLNVVDAVYKRCMKSKCKDIVVFCISNSSVDDVLFEDLKHKGIHVYRGDENNLVERFFRACEKFEIDQFVRVTGDSPLVDPKVIDMFFEVDQKIDFVDGYSPHKLPGGTVVSRFNVNIIKLLNDEEQCESHLEHVVTSQLIKSNYEIKIPEKWNNPMARYSLDYEEDYSTLKIMFKNDGIIDMDTDEIIELYFSRRMPNHIYAINGY